MYKSKLQEWCQKNKVDLPTYTTVPSSNGIGWISTVEVDGHKITIHSDEAKKKGAENAVAEHMLSELSTRRKNEKVMIKVPLTLGRVCVIFDTSLHKVMNGFLKNVLCANVDLIAIGSNTFESQRDVNYVEYVQVSNPELFLPTLTIECTKEALERYGHAHKIIIVTHRKKVDNIIQALGHQFPGTQFLKCGDGWQEVANLITEES